MNVLTHTREIFARIKNMDMESFLIKMADDILVAFARMNDMERDISSFRMDRTIVDRFNVDCFMERE